MTDVASSKSSGWWVAAFLIGTFGTGALKAADILTGPVSTVLFLASFLLIIPMVRANQRAMAARGITSSAMTRYSRRFMVASLAYVALLFASLWIARATDPGLALRVILAMVAALPVMFMIRAMALLLKEEQDEYLRSRLVSQSLVATGFLLTVATLYGFLNTFDVAPRVDAWAAFPLWAIGLGIGRLVQGDPAC
ncbi:hypothetical protein H9L12_10895 [Sphingomonas rhizophila]|uniref:Uncharacterized protein n=1 Tax=Sphingomonas rhizophila TaxID=2071607 RepID=A0A7G9SA77_9SPHN|nr:hypothetical protein [Sphingomonas rhizophila]QNN64752.1 hypothetical protein H9L12_10895 [Sphingomonas rhizophila]